MVKVVDEDRHVFAHICGFIPRTLEQLRLLIGGIGGDDLLDIAFFIGFVEDIKSGREETEGGKAEYTLCMKSLQFLCNIQHAFTGCDHVIDDDNILTLHGITKEFMGNDGVLAVHYL